MFLSIYYTYYKDPVHLNTITITETEEDCSNSALINATINWGIEMYWIPSCVHLYFVILTDSLLKETGGCTHLSFTQKTETTKKMDGEKDIRLLFLTHYIHSAVRLSMR